MLIIITSNIYLFTNASVDKLCNTNVRKKYTENFIHLFFFLLQLFITLSFLIIESNGVFHKHGKGIFDYASSFLPKVTDYFTKSSGFHHHKKGHKDEHHDDGHHKDEHHHHKHSHPHHHHKVEHPPHHDYGYFDHHYNFPIYGYHYFNNHYFDGFPIHNAHYHGLSFDDSDFHHF